MNSSLITGIRDFEMGRTAELTAHLGLEARNCVYFCWTRYQFFWRLYQMGGELSVYVAVNSKLRLFAQIMRYGRVDLRYLEC